MELLTTFAENGMIKKIGNEQYKYCMEVLMSTEGEVLITNSKEELIYLVMLDGKVYSAHRTEEGANNKIERLKMGCCKPVNMLPVILEKEEKIIQE